MLMHVVNVNKDVLKANNEIAQSNRKLLIRNRVFTMNIMGAIGSGKTTLIEEAINALGDHYRIAVIAGDVVAEMDASRFERLGVRTVAANTGRECHLDARLVERSLADLDLKNIDILFIENVGNLICPVDYKLGERVRVVIVSVSEGDDTVMKHPMIFKSSDLAIVNKVDISEAVDADPAKMKADIKQLKPSIPVLLTSKNDRISIDRWIEYIESYIEE
ncbi:hydrogenase nickel incorporation protein HypB [Methanococcoides methylutens]|uniref:[NiFe] hydrogenase nickel incorporation-associated protein HypB n=1 Tax=Methanococcoides methylutens MM1 TaxID=1434104 RepID=A0A0E3SR98_METMT|nr:hydrogenase nickel incorporation protein HypB [Methanococcoides methylutens]AKB85391.1 [NiFe] hydrogenase nickel incorporation-associated protein HypB [Methanococcoides methylutens MM1]